MPITVEQKTGQIFQTWIDDYQTAYTVLEQDLINAINRMRSLGMSEREIFNRLMYSLDNDMAEFQSFKGWIGGSSDNMINTISQIESNETIKGLSDLWIWELDPTAKDHCEDCKRHSIEGEKEFSEWEEIGLPGYGNTQCGIYCRCTLTPTDNV